MSESIEANLAVSVLVSDLFRHAAGEITARLVLRFGVEHLQLAEDVVQEALLKALATWPFHGIPNDPRRWLHGVARNAAIDTFRRKQPELFAALDSLEETIASSPSAPSDSMSDQTLAMVFLCSHPTLPRLSRVALTLKLACGFSVKEIAHALVLDERAVQQRLVRAKRSLRAETEPGALGELTPLAINRRLSSVLEVLYLMFNEGYAACEGEMLVRSELSAEALRLLDLLLSSPATARPQAHAMAALFCFHGSRNEARLSAGRDGIALIPLSEQDRSLWDRHLIVRGFHHLASAMTATELSRYHLEAGIASCHAHAERFEDTDWKRILEYYDQLVNLTQSSVAALSRLVACAHVRGPDIALHEIAELRKRFQPLDSHHYHAVHGHLLQIAGQVAKAKQALTLARDRAPTVPEKNYLTQLIRVAAAGDS